MYLKKRVSSYTLKTGILYGWEVYCCRKIQNKKRKVRFQILNGLNAIKEQLKASSWFFN
ncbi:MAG: hypothetical protein ACJAZR_002439 [Sediminicola sp.]|jgi:hypothetical protein